ncbi:hypothetical protein OS493_008829 [Desmophyllum pertusum]|uniref:Uncharacterized protein n=1 Tax=Desmophyllum pertusum TaxID=174260 RepID=A0A9W9ZEZ3_9CNID|nr:hypothetical protein OS493_008829 [Desmophyllum pertusum]
MAAIAEEDVVEQESDPRMPRTRSSRELRWHSIKKRMDDNRMSTEIQLLNVRRLAKLSIQMHDQREGKQKDRRSRSSTFPVIEEKCRDSTRSVRFTLMLR